MAYGSVNVTGASAADLAAVKTLAQTANTAANSAASAAAAAQSTADAAKTTADSAASAAAAAQTTANSAMEKAETNESDITKLQAAVENAQSTADGANTAAANAASAAAAAQTTANEALEAANAASTAASNAQTAADNAQTSADAALKKITQIANTIETVPSQSGTLTYTGAEQSPSWNSYSSDQLTIGGTTSATDAGTYTATFTPSGDYTWSDGTQDAVSVTWTINKASLTVPSQSGTLTYTGAAQSPTWDSYDSTALTIGGTTSATDAGTYTATFTPGSNYQWSDGTTTAKSVSWTIARASLTVPSQSGTLTYTGAAQSPTWDSYDSTTLTIGGTTSATDAGTYTATFTPTSNYEWSDGTTTAKSVSWSIAKAEGSLTLSSTALELDISNISEEITVTRSGDGTITAISSDAGVATVSLSGTTLTVTGVSTGSATITVSVAATSNYTAPDSITISVSVELPSTTLADNTPAEIQATAQAGQAANYWSVGDTVPIELNGTVGILEFASETYYAVIIGFDHNSDIEGENTIHFQFGKDSDGTDIAFVDSSYGSTGYSTGFRMNTTNSNSGGWESSHMRNTICAEFLLAMPEAWQEVIASCTKYTDNVGGGNGSVLSNVTATSDKIWLLAAYEECCSNGNIKELQYQESYDYYSNGNGFTKYQHSDNTQTCYYFSRSVVPDSSKKFVGVISSNSSTQLDVYRSEGFAPGFMVA